MRKKKKIAIIGLIVLLFIAGCFFGIYTYYFSPFYYNTDWITGKRYNEIVERYGVFYRNFDGTYDPEVQEMFFPGKYYYLKTSERQGFLDKIPAKYIVVVFNENGIAEDSYERLGWYGG